MYAPKTHIFLDLNCSIIIYIMSALSYLSCDVSIINLNQLHLQEGGLHADINGDGVLDHVQVIFLLLSFFVMWRCYISRYSDG